MTLDFQRTFFIGDLDLPTQARRGNLFHHFNVNEFNLIVWSMASFIQEAMGLGANLSTQIHKSVSDNLISRYLSAMDRLLLWVADGNILCIHPHEISWQFLEPNQVRAQGLMALRPFDGLTFVESHGRLVTPSSYPTLLEPFADHFEYQYTLKGNDVVPLLHTAPSQRQRSEIVAGVVRREKGIVVFAPPLPRARGYLEFLESLNALPALLAHAPQDPPPWTSLFQSERERSALNAAADLEAEISKLRSTADEHLCAADKERKLKLLYSGSDYHLVEKVAEALAEFGLKVVEGPHPRADLLIYDGTRLAAAEVKGLSGPARETNVRQVQRWAADVNATLTKTTNERDNDIDLLRYAEKLAQLGLDLDTPIMDLECRGLMVVGTYKDTPLDKRTSESFPDPVQRIIARSDISALTGLVFYCWVQEVRQDPKRKRVIVDQLLSTNGVLPVREWGRWIRGV